MNTREKAIDLYKRLDKTRLEGWTNHPYGAVIDHIVHIRGEHHDYIKLEYANFILYFINHFKEIIGDDDKLQIAIDAMEHEVKFGGCPELKEALEKIK